MTAGLDVVDLVRELVGRTTISGDAAAQRDVLGTLTEVLRERAPHLQVTEGRDPDHPWTLLRPPAAISRSGKHYRGAKYGPARFAAAPCRAGQPAPPRGKPPAGQVYRPVQAVS